MKTSAKVLLAGAAAVAAGVALTVRFRRADGTTETVEGIGEVTITPTPVNIDAGKLPTLPQDAVGSPSITVDRSKEPLSIRNNNPGNLRYFPAIKWQGQTGGDAGGYAIFKTPEEGGRAAFIDLHTGFTRDREDTIRLIITEWAPHTENPTSAYITFVAKKLNVSPDQKLTYLVHAKKIMAAIWEFEAGRKWFADSLVETAYRMAGKS